MGGFLEPTSAGLLVLCALLAVGITGATVLVWDRPGWVAARFVGPVLSFVLLGVVALVAINLVVPLFVTWSDVWGFVR
jgi:hypothetical protein